MKKILLVLSLAGLFTAATPLPTPPSTPPPTSVGGGWGVVMTPPPFQGGGWGVVLHQSEYSRVALPDCYTFTVDNASIDSIGSVRISGASSYADFDVTTTANYQQDICFVAVSATVNGVTITYPNTGDVQLASGAWIKVIWQSTSLIEIADQRGSNSPVR